MTDEQPKPETQILPAGSENILALALDGDPMKVAVNHRLAKWFEQSPFWGEGRYVCSLSGPDYCAHELTPLGEAVAKILLERNKARNDLRDLRQHVADRLNAARGAST